MHTIDAVTPCNFPIAFSQVREDPQLDLHALQNIKPDARILMIGSGGDTLLHLATSHSFKSIDVVDANASQLKLCRLKCKLLEFSTNKRLQLLGHKDYDPELRLQEVTQVCRELDIDAKDLGPTEIIAHEGLDYLGRFERLFLEIQKNLKHTQKKLRQAQVLDPKSQRELQETFQEFFALPTLVSLFGPEATQNPQQDFDKHFLAQTQKFIANPTAYDSPFLHQFLCGAFQQKTYAWHDSNLQDLNPAIKFHQVPMHEHLKTSAKNSYDFIHLSNILDWLSVDEARDLLKNVKRCLSPEGKVLIRQLNSKLDIRGCAPFLNWDKKISEYYLQKDQSFFYRQIHCGSNS